MSRGKHRRRRDHAANAASEESRSVRTTPPAFADSWIEAYDEPPCRTRRQWALKMTLRYSLVPLALAQVFSAWMLHGYTTDLAYTDGGGQGFTAGRLPLIGQLYYLVVVALRRGTIFNYFTGWFLAAFGCLALIVLWSRAAKFVDRMD